MRLALNEHSKLKVKDRALQKKAEEYNVVMNKRYLNESEYGYAICSKPRYEIDGHNAHVNITHMLTCSVRVYTLVIEL